MFKLKVREFNLDHTLSCGQVFRWKKLDNGFWYGVIGKRVVKIRQEGDQLYFTSSNNQLVNPLINKYFNLNFDYKAMIKSVSKDPKIRNMVKSSYGLRILKQDPWECLISYIISINKNIPAINCLIENICAKYGRKITFEGVAYCTFPKPSELKHLETHHIRACRVGFRDRYIKDAIDKVLSGEVNLNILAKLSYPEAKAELIKIVGVGSKVADCILLFAYNMYEAFPVDVWIKRAMKKLYAIRKDRDILPFAAKRFDQYAGYAQEFIYFGSRKQ